jgi:broad specificity phosphatase PhoE
VIVVSHGGFLSALHKTIVGHDKGAPIIENCAICEVLSDGITTAIVQWNVLASEQNRSGETFGGGTFG